LATFSEVRSNWRDCQSGVCSIGAKRRRKRDRSNGATAWSRHACPCASLRSAAPHLIHVGVFDDGRHGLPQAQNVINLAAGIAGDRRIVEGPCASARAGRDAQILGTLLAFNSIIVKARCHTHNAIHDDIMIIVHLLLLLFRLSQLEADISSLRFLCPYFAESAGWDTSWLNIWNSCGNYCVAPKSCDFIHDSCYH
jgi:hypothetical protein